MKRATFALAIGGVLLLISWVTAPAALTPAPVAPLSETEINRIEQAAQAVVPVTAQVDDQAAKLRARLAQPPPEPNPTRNPFQFGRGTVPRTGTVPVQEDRNRNRDAESPAGDSGTKTGTVPILPTLVAIMADEQDGTVIRNAALAMGDDITVVRIGQSFDRFVVDAIATDWVRLIDTTSPTRATFTIAIR